MLRPESYYILTPSGYLHERRTNDHTSADSPGFSLFLPECTLGAPAKESDKSHKFHVEGNKAVKSSFESKVKNTLRFGGKEIAYTFRARTHAELLAWHEILDKLSRDTKAPAAAPREKTSYDPVSAAVANVGYAQKETPAPSAAAQADPHTAAVERAEQHQHNAATHSTATHHTAEEDDEESGGSSAEEEDDEARHIRTAPTTPAPIDGVKSHLDTAGAATHTNTTASTSHSTAEVLPTYAGNPQGVSVSLLL